MMCNVATALLVAIFLSGSSSLAVREFHYPVKTENPGREDPGCVFAAAVNDNNQLIG